ncbi:hypothetical protein ABKN59_011902, partial [Abortiporus biennis]
RVDELEKVLGITRTNTGEITISSFKDNVLVESNHRQIAELHMRSLYTSLAETAKIISWFLHNLRDRSKFGCEVFVNFRKRCI